MSAQRKHEDAYQHATLRARESRAAVAQQLADLVVSADKAGSQHELVERILATSARSREVAQAQGRQQVAREEGLPVAPAVREEHEARSLLRDAVMQLCVAGATWVADMDFEELRRRDVSLNGALQP